MADPLLQGHYPKRGLYQALAVAAMCLQEQAATRPLIGDVVTALSYLASHKYDPNAASTRNSSVGPSTPRSRSRIDNQQHAVCSPNQSSPGFGHSDLIMGASEVAKIGSESSRHKWVLEELETCESQMDSLVHLYDGFDDSGSHPNGLTLTASRSYDSNDVLRGTTLSPSLIGAPAYRTETSLFGLEMEKGGGGSRFDLGSSSLPCDLALDIVSLLEVPFQSIFLLSLFLFSQSLIRCNRLPMFARWGVVPASGKTFAPPIPSGSRSTSGDGPPRLTTSLHRLRRWFYGFRLPDEHRSRIVSLTELAMGKEGEVLGVLNRGAIHEVLRVQITKVATSTA
ncbi:hypothetical protein BHM03_00045555 [Ensete ventricosum]|nr:hypothetical protein BHM03_00045555 [Ensete ventricosum]